MRIPVVAAALCLVPALAVSQSLGAAARNQAKKRAQAPAARSYSDADLRSEERQPATGEATAAATEDGAVASAGIEELTPEAAARAQLDREEKERNAQEARWRTLAREALARIAAAQHELEDCRRSGG